jgi:hypothetical protein
VFVLPTSRTKSMCLFSEPISRAESQPQGLKPNFLTLERHG